MIVAGTGHRPDKLGGYGWEPEARLRCLAISWLEVAKPERVISGMALGWDQALASAAHISGIPFTAAVPFLGQEKMWPAESQKRFQTLLEKAEKVEIVCSGGYSPAKMQKRNEWMVDNCTHVLALWNGTTGGTANCVKYAQKQEKPIINLWKEWVELHG